MSAIKQALYIVENVPSLEKLFANVTKARFGFKVSERGMREFHQYGLWNDEEQQLSHFGNLIYSVLTPRVQCALCKEAIHTLSHGSSHQVLAAFAFSFVREFCSNPTCDQHPRG